MASAARALQFQAAATQRDTGRVRPSATSKIPSGDVGGQGQTIVALLCRSVLLSARCWLNPRETEGVGFEPTVSFPTLDFESSALNRTQPPFQ